MAKLTITLEVDLSELIAITDLADNTRHFIELIKSNQGLPTVSFANSQERNLLGIKDILEKIEHLVERC